VVERPPKDYEALIALIHAEHDRMSRSNQLVAQLLTQSPNDVAIHSTHELARRCKLHASSLVRFAQSLGFTGFKDLQRLFRERLTKRAPGFETRARQLQTEISETGTDARKLLAELVSQDAAALDRLLGDVTDRQLDQAVQLLARAETIYLLGQLRSAPIVELMRYMLTMVRRRVILLDPAGGLSTHMARLIGPGDVLVAVSFRYYATEVVNVTEEAIGRRVPVIAITDSDLSPLTRNASVLFTVPEQEAAFTRSLAAPICLAQAIVLALAAHLSGSGDKAPPIPIVTQSF